MAEIITETKLASYLQVSIPTDAAKLYVDLANGLVTELVTDAGGTALLEGTIPSRVTAITFEAAARAYRNPQGLTSTTTSIDDWSRTERREGGSDATAAGVYLTDAEENEILRKFGLAGEPKRSIQMHVPGYIGYRR